MCRLVLRLAGRKRSSSLRMARTCRQRRNKVVHFGPLCLCQWRARRECALVAQAKAEIARASVSTGLVVSLSTLDTFPIWSRCDPIRRLDDRITQLVRCYFDPHICKPLTQGVTFCAQVFHLLPLSSDAKAARRKSPHVIAGQSSSSGAAESPSLTNPMSCGDAP